MNIPSKLLKSNEFSSDKIQQYHKCTTTYHNKIKIFKKNSDKSNKNLTSFRDEALNWFFSLDMITRLIVSSIENKFISNILHQLYVHQKDDSRRKYAQRSEKEDSLSSQQIALTPEGNMDVIRRSSIKIPSIFYQDPYNFMNYFQMKEDSVCPGEVHQNFMREIRFYKSEETILTSNEFNNYCNYFTLSESILSDEGRFRFFYDKLSGGQSFLNPVATEYDTTSKVYSISLPNWIKASNILGNQDQKFYTCAQFFAAFIEQIIIVRYILYNQNKDISELIRTSHLKRTLDQKKELDTYILSFPIAMNFYDMFNCDQLINTIYRDKNIMDYTKYKEYHTQPNYNVLYKFLFNPEFNTENEIRMNVKEFLCEFAYGLNEKLIDSLIFTNISKIYTWDDILLRKMYETIINLHSKKIADDLINDLNDDIDCSKPKKKKKKKNSVNSAASVNEKELSSTEKKYAFSFIKRKNVSNEGNTTQIQPEQGEFEKKDFLGSEMLIKRSISSENMVEINNFAKDLIYKVIDLACESSKKVANANVTISSSLNSPCGNKFANENEQFDSETNYSSDYADTSDNLREKKKNKKNKFFLYDTANVKNKKHNHQNRKENSTSVNTNNKIANQNKSYSITNNSHSFNTNTTTNEKNQFFHKKVFKEENTTNFKKEKRKESSQEQNITNINIINLPMYQPPIGGYYPMYYHYMRPNDFMIHHNPISYDFFYIKLNKDIQAYTERVESNLQQTKPFKDYVIKYLEGIVTELLDGEPAVFEVYGSFASDLGIESSDVDMTLKLRNGKEIGPFMGKLANHLRNMSDVFDVVNPIFTASVPVVKIVVDPLKIKELSQQVEQLRRSESFIGYEFHSEDLEKIKIDLSFQTYDKSVTQMQVEYIRSWVAIHPEIKPITRIIKRILHLNKLNNSFNGGLGSYSLFLLVLAYVKINKTGGNLGKLLIEFLLYFGTFIDFNFTLIDVNVENPFILCPEVLECVPTILDPITYLNAAKSSYRVMDIKYLFSKVYEHVNEIKFLMDNQQISYEQNVISELLRKK